MKFNLVHDIQSAYRKVVKAFSYPGEIVSLKEEANKINFKMNTYPVTQVLMYMLLDTDTTFHMVSKDKTVAHMFEQLTYSVETELQKARYIFIHEDCNACLAETIKEAYEGTLSDPHLAATIIVECNDISKAKMYQLKGCGIKDRAFVGLDIDEQWMDSRNLKNIEFPLGVDLMFIDKNANCVALPRTTQIERV